MGKKSITTGSVQYLLPKHDKERTAIHQHRERVNKTTDGFKQARAVAMRDRSELVMTAVLNVRERRENNIPPTHPPTYVTYCHIQVP